MVVIGRGDYASTRAAYNKARRAGDYKPSLGRSLIEGGGQLLGSAFGFGQLGKTAGRHLSHFLGLGDYSIKDNVFLHGRLPEVYNMPSGGGTIIRFQEFLGDVTTGAANTFNVNGYTINPANPSTFPWLSQLAANYEQYSFEGLIFEFRSTSADALNSTNTALGTVMMATQYDVADDDFSSKSEMLNYEFSNSVKPSENCLHMIECAPRQSTLTELYTLSGNPPANVDPRFYNLGKFQIATSGFQAANVTIGELHVTYQVRLMKPKLSDALGEATRYAAYDLTGCTTGFMFGTPGTEVQLSDSIGVTFPSAGQIRLAATSVPKNYMVSFTSRVQAAADALVTLAAPIISGGAQIQPSRYLLNPQASLATKLFHWVYFFRSTASAITNITFGLTYAQSVGATLRIIELPADFNG